MHIERRDKLTWTERRQARRIARRLWIDFRGNRQACEDHAEQYAQQYGVSVVVIIAVIGLILQLIQFWIDNRAGDDPGEHPMAGEPGGGE